jgi:hypothetical protein
MMAIHSKSSRLDNAKDFFARMLQAAFPDAITEYRFYSKRRWRLDWYVPSIRVGIEIEGGIWTRGRHNRPLGFMRDMEKYNSAALMGITIYRIPAHELKSCKKVMEHIQRIRSYLLRKRA